VFFRCMLGSAQLTLDIHKSWTTSWYLLPLKYFQSFLIIRWILRGIQWFLWGIRLFFYEGPDYFLRAIRLFFVKSPIIFCEESDYFLWRIRLFFMKNLIIFYEESDYSYPELFEPFILKELHTEWSHLSLKKMMHLLKLFTSNLSTWIQIERLSWKHLWSWIEFVFEFNISREHNSDNETKLNLNWIPFKIRNSILNRLWIECHSSKILRSWIEFEFELNISQQYTSILNSMWIWIWIECRSRASLRSWLQCEFEFEFDLNTSRE
jgi:hypothetical protein